MARWVPESEKGRFVSFAYLGGSFGSVVTFPLCGLITDHLGWVRIYVDVVTINVDFSFLVCRNGYST